MGRPARSWLRDNALLMSEWDYVANTGLDPTLLAGRANKKAAWVCGRDASHRWVAVISSRGAGRGCPYCAGNLVSAANALAVRLPALAAQWHPTLNGNLTPDLVSYMSSRKVHWKCPNGPDHEWEAPVNNRAQGRGCPFCAGFRVSVTNSIATKHPALAAQWHPKRNRPLTPAQTQEGSYKKVWWACANGHEWMAQVKNRAYLGNGCPFCANQVVGQGNSLDLVRPDLAAHWHPKLNGKLTPAQVVPGSGKRVWWVCDKGPDHVWRAKLVHRHSAGSGCPFCENQKISITNSLATVFPELAAELDAVRSGITADQVIRGSNKVLWWRCRFDQAHHWRAAVFSRCNGTGCPYCRIFPRSVAEVFITYEIAVALGVDPANHRIKLGRRVADVDLLLPGHRIGIEYDGAYWHRGKEDRDRKKGDLMAKKGWRLIRARERPLEPIGPLDVQVPTNAAPQVIALGLLNRLASLGVTDRAVVDDYQLRAPVASDLARAEVDRLKVEAAARRAGRVPRAIVAKRSRKPPTVL